jgi:hypothetical protein
VESRNGQQEIAGTGSIKVEDVEQGDVAAEATSREEEVIPHADHGSPLKLATA